ncbi:hypothetical protein CW304_01650 [Bacillus sp. UFRGS-B20]|nr:hypothetical protein CW304_01650 [Bacillus sp. UFRGS-B20]
MCLLSLFESYLLEVFFVFPHVFYIEIRYSIYTISFSKLADFQYSILLFYMNVFWFLLENILWILNEI